MTERVYCIGENLETMVRDLYQRLEVMDRIGSKTVLALRDVVRMAPDIQPDARAYIERNIRFAKAIARARKLLGDTLAREQKRNPDYLEEIVV